jgi:hypothetical protein
VSEEERAQRIKLAEALLSLGMCLWCLWLMIPEHRRQQWKMQRIDRLRRSTDWAARRAGAGSMRAELATGAENYALPYALASLRDRLAAAYDRTRGITP